MLFNNQYKFCKFCGRTLPAKYDGECCSYCLENELFQNVKDFIRANDVNEYQVALYFDIPVLKVKKWIREGRIEYKDHDGKIINSLHCQNCGEPVTFGSLCSKCIRTVGKSLHGYATTFTEEAGKMRFLDEDFEKEERKRHHKKGD